MYILECKAFRPVSFSRFSISDVLTWHSDIFSIFRRHIFIHRNIKTRHFWITFHIFFYYAASTMASLYSRVNSLAVRAKSSVNTPGTEHFCWFFTNRNIFKKSREIRRRSTAATCLKNDDLWGLRSCGGASNKYPTDYLSQICFRSAFERIWPLFLQYVVTSRKEQEQSTLSIMKTIVIRKLRRLWLSKENEWSWSSVGEVCGRWMTL